MREKLTVEELKKMFLALQEESNKLYDKYKNDEISKEIMEIESEKISNEFINKVISYDLSDIPASAYKVFLSESIDLSKTHANIDFNITLIDYKCKYNFKGCNISNLDKLDYSFLINNKDAFDKKVVDLYPYLFEELCTLEIGNIKIKYINNKEALKKAQELSKYIEDKLDLITDITEIHITNGRPCTNDNIMTLHCNYDVIGDFEILETENNIVYREIKNLVKNNNFDLINIKINILKDFNTYFNTNKLEPSYYIKLFLYYSKDIKLLTDYIKTNNVEPIIEKYFKTVLTESLNYYFENANDEFIETNYLKYSNLFFVNLQTNSDINESNNQDNNNILNLSIEEIVKNTAEILFEIDSSGELANYFNYALNHNQISFNGTNNYFSLTENKIYIKNEYSYSTVRVLIHEFMHYYSYNYTKEHDNNKYYLTELPSIFFERYAVDYMANKYSLDKSKIGFAITRDLMKTILEVHFINDILNLYKIKRNRDIVYNDIISYKDDTSDKKIDDTELQNALLALFNNGNIHTSVMHKQKNSVENKKTFFIEIYTLNKYMPIIDKLNKEYYSINKNQCYSLLDKDEKYSLSYTIGAELSKIYLDNPKASELFLNLARNIYNPKCNEAEIFSNIMENLNNNYAK